MSRRKRRRCHAPRVVVQGATFGEPVIGTRPPIGVRAPDRKTDRAPPPEAERQLLQEAVREGVKAIEAKVDACIDQVLADAQALETSARLLDDAPRWIFPVPHKAETVAALFAFAAGMRLAANRFTHSDEIPF